MPIGKLIYRARAKYGKGLKVAYYRDQVRPRVLQSRPTTGLVDDRCEIHVLTSQADWLNLLWALKSFYHFSGRRYLLSIHDDGTLDHEAIGEIERLFPDARLIRRTTADAEVLPTLAEFPRCEEFRRSNHLSPKLFDFRHYLRADRMLLLDSDVLFFDKPTELLRRIENDAYRLNSVNCDLESAYTVLPVAAREHCGVELVGQFNSGLGLIHRDSLRLDWLEEFLGLPGIHSHFWRIEQTLFALCSSRFGVELLPKEYSVFIGRRRATEPVRHYIGQIRHLMYSEGIAALRRQLLPSGKVPA
jgi:hypothetical protein